MEEKIEFVFERETKNTIRYEEVTKPGTPPILGTIYVQKWWAGTSKKLTLSIKRGE